MTEAPDTHPEPTDAPPARTAAATVRRSGRRPTTALRTDGGQSAEATDDDPAEADSDDSLTEDDSRDLSTTLEWAGLLVLGLLAVIATFRFYLAASTAIGRLVSPEYEPLFQAGFNLVVLLLAITGISLLARRLVLDR